MQLVNALSASHYGLHPLMTVYCSFLRFIQQLMSEPEEVITMSGQRTPRKCSIGVYKTDYTTVILRAFCSYKIVLLEIYCIYLFILFIYLQDSPTGVGINQQSTAQIIINYSNNSRNNSNKILL